MKRIIKQRDKNLEEKLPKAPKTNTANNAPYRSGPGILTLTLAPIILFLTAFPGLWRRAVCKAQILCEQDKACFFLDKLLIHHQVERHRKKKIFYTYLWNLLFETTAFLVLREHPKRRGKLQRQLSVTPVNLKKKKKTQTKTQPKQNNQKNPLVVGWKSS